MIATRCGADDKHRSLVEIQSSLPERSLISRLIAMQSYQMDLEKRIEFVENLECLYIGPRKRSHDDVPVGSTVLRRRTIDGSTQRDFVALSYTWGPSPGFEHATPCGSYLVQKKNSEHVEPSPVRDRLFQVANIGSVEESLMF